MDGGSTVVNEGDDALIGLPPGFRFHPTDEEIITHYLTPRVVNRSFTATVIGEVDLNKCEPWDLHKKAKSGEKEWWFYCQRDRKYPTGMRTNRATDSGYWKATGKDKEIKKKGKSGFGKLVGMKKTLVFYKGRAPKGEKTNWVMHEFRLEGEFSYYNMSRASKDEWVVCRVVQKNNEIIKNQQGTNHGMTRTNFSLDEFFDGPPSLPPLMDSPAPRFNQDRPGSSFTHSNNNNVTNSYTESYPFYFPHEQSQILQEDQDYKNLIVSPYDYNFDINSFQMSQFTNDHQSDFTFGTNLIPHLSSEYMDHASVLEEDAKKTIKRSYVTNNTHKSSKINSVSSQDTGISNDVTTEISSASMHDIYTYKPL